MTICSFARPLHWNITVSGRLHSWIRCHAHGSRCVKCTKEGSPTSPARLTRGPPLLPLLTAASVWMNSLFGPARPSSTACQAHTHCLSGGSSSSAAGAKEPRERQRQACERALNPHGHPHNIGSTATPLGQSTAVERQQHCRCPCPGLLLQRIILEPEQDSPVARRARHQAKTAHEPYCKGSAPCGQRRRRCRQ